MALHCAHRTVSVGSTDRSKTLPSLPDQDTYSTVGGWSCHWAYHASTEIDLHVLQSICIRSTGVYPGNPNLLILSKSVEKLQNARQVMPHECILVPPARNALHLWGFLACSFTDQSCARACPSLSTRSRHDRGKKSSSRSQDLCCLG